MLAVMGAGRQGTGFGNHGRERRRADKAGQEADTREVKLAVAIADHRPPAGLGQIGDRITIEVDDAGEGCWPVHNRVVPQNFR